MKMFAHTFNTWALAQLLHPLIFLVYLFFIDSVETAFMAGGIVFIFFFSVFASIPSLLLAWLLLYVISNAQLSAGEKLIAWFVSVIAVIPVNLILLSVAADGILDGEMYEMTPPSMIAAVLSILIRLRSFFQFQLNYKMNAENN